MNVLINSAKMSFIMQKRYYLNFLFNCINSIFLFIPLVCMSIMFDTNYSILWISSGMCIWIIFSQILWSVGLSIKSEIKEGTLEQILLTNSKLIYIFIGKAIPGLTFALISTSIVSLFLIIYFNLNLLILFNTWIFIFFMFPYIFSLSIFIALLVIRFKEIFAFLQVLMIFLNIIFGITFPLKNFPSTFLKLSNFIFFPKVIENYRYIFLNNIKVLNYSIILNLILLFGMGVCMFLFSVFVFNKEVRKIKIKGTYNYV